MKKLLPVLLTAVLVLSAVGAMPYPREMGDMALLRTMGVDQGQDGLLVTVSTGPRARGLQGEREPAMSLSAQRASLSAAALALQGLSDNYVFFGYVDQLLLGEDLADRGIRPVLDYFAQDVELSLGAQLWLVRGGTAKQAIEAGGDQGLAGRLSILRTDGEMGIAAIPRTAGEVYSDLMELGASYAPALECPDGESAPAELGYAVLKGDALAGFLEGEAARGLELLEGRPMTDVLEGWLPGGQVTARVTGAVTLCRLRPGDQGLSVSCRVTAQVVECEQPLTQEEIELFCEQIRAREESRIGEALTQMRGWGADCLGLGARAALASPGVWPGLQGRWEQVFVQTEPEITLRVELCQS